MSLMLHVNANPVDYDALRELPLPEATATHVPIPHFRVVDLVKSTVAMYGHEVVEEHYGVTEDAMRFFGVLSLKSPYTGYEDMVALRNSNDRAFPVTVGFGNRVFCCDNMALCATYIVKRRHTANLKRDLPGIIGEMIEPLADQREAQHRRLSHYQATQLDQAAADHILMQSYREGIVNLQRLPEVLQGWQEPPHEDWGRGTAWTFLNATTAVLEGRVLENTQATPRLHEIIDGVCEKIAA